jgi:ubiquinone/menaquinone biosynthesis C-methylase UbiE
MSNSYYQNQKLFKGTAWFYARYRPAYPESVIQLLKNKFCPQGKGALLDLGSGTGELSIPLAPYFEKVIALDVDSDMLVEGRLKAQKAGISNIDWVQGRAEELPSEWGPFKLVTVGKAFHWMEQEKVLISARERLVEGGGFAILGEGCQIWQAKTGWQSVVVQLIRRYLGEERRAGTGFAKLPQFKWEDLLNQFFSITQFDYSIQQTNVWTVDSLLGYLYSTSFCSKELLGDKAVEFEPDLRESLLRLNPEDRFEETIPVSVMMGWK